MLWLVLQQLKSGDPAKRRQAAERLAAEPDIRALDGLAKASQDSDLQVKIAALTALAAHEDERVTELLLRAMRDHQAEVRQTAISRLKDAASERVQSALAGALRDSDAGVRSRAARALESCPWRPTEREDEVWLAIARGKLTHAASFGSIAIKPLETVYQNGPYNLQVGAIEALGSIPDDRVLKLLLRALKSADHTVCFAAITALMNAGGPGMETELAPLLKHKDARIRVAAVEALAKLDPQRQGEPLRALLRDPSWDVRCAVASALSKINDPPTVDALIAALQDSNGDVRAAIASALGRLRDARAIGPLVLALKDSDTNVRKMAAGALALIDPEWADTEAARHVAAQLRTALNSPDWFVRRAAALALEQMGENKGKNSQELNEVATPARRRQLAVISVFEELLRDADSDLRLAAALSLGKLGEARTRSALMTALTDTDEAVRRVATEALEHLHAE
ncbi:MAG TPA: HEAT repeat domain-containing protein [Verrucomicrobiae bacterium]|jgi:HEAT repeat protein|nr:HEAT repeat domain-containing protein [Verrucomicrobiae bacterium]